MQGAAHKRVRTTWRRTRRSSGHEFCGVIDEVGRNWAHKFKKGDGFVIQPAHSYQGSLSAPGYSIPNAAGTRRMSTFPGKRWRWIAFALQGDVYFYGSLAEPMSCIIGTFHACTTPETANMSTTWASSRAARWRCSRASARWARRNRLRAALRSQAELLVVTDMTTRGTACGEHLHRGAREGMRVELHYVQHRQGGKPGCRAACALRRNGLQRRHLLCAVRRWSSRAGRSSP